MHLYGITNCFLLRKRESWNEKYWPSSPVNLRQNTFQTSISIKYKSEKETVSGIYVSVVSKSTNFTFSRIYFVPVGLLANKSCSFILWDWSELDFKKETLCCIPFTYCTLLLAYEKPSTKICILVGKPCVDERSYCIEKVLLMCTSLHPKIRTYTNVR